MGRAWLDVNSGSYRLYRRELTIWEGLASTVVHGEDSKSIEQEISFRRAKRQEGEDVVRSQLKKSAAWLSGRDRFSSSSK